MSEIDEKAVGAMINKEMERAEEARRYREHGKPMHVAFSGIKASMSDDALLQVWDAFIRTGLTRDIVAFVTERVAPPPGEAIFLLGDDGPWYSFFPRGLVSMVMARETRRLMMQPSMLRQIFPPLPLDLDEKP